jgi:hypothetical protein
MSGFKPQQIPLPIESGGAFARADLRFLDLDHSSESYEGRIFFNRPDADLKTATRPEEGYAGSLYVFGHPHCWGDEGHCAVPPGPLHGYDHRVPHHLVPQVHVVQVTDAVRGLLEQKVTAATVSVLPIVRRGRRRRIAEDLLRFSRLELVTYD